MGINFQVQNQDKMDEVEKSLKRSAVDAAKVAVALSAVTAAFLAMANAAGQAGEAIKQFALNSGLGVSQIQRWEFAAQSMGVAAKGATNTILALQKAQAQIALGEGDISGFQFFGIDPRQNPFKVLEQLRLRIRQIGEDQIGIARERAAALGISDEMFQFLRLSNPELQKQLELTQEEVIQLSKMNSAWVQVKLSIVAVGQKFVSVLAKPMEVFWKVLKSVIDRFAMFVNWLNKGSLAANIIRGILIAVVAIIGVLAVAFALLAAGITAVTVATIALGLVMSPIAIILGTIAAIVAIVVGIVALMVAVWQDLMIALEGGDALLTPIVKKWRDFADAIRFAFNTIKEFTGFSDKEKRANFTASTSFVWDNIKEDLGSLVKGGPNATNIGGMIGDMLSSATNPVPIGAGPTSNSNQTNIEVNVDGSGSPRETGAAVVDSLKRAVSDASFQQPAPAF